MKVKLTGNFGSSRALRASLAVLAVILCIAAWQLLYLVAPKFTVVSPLSGLLGIAILHSRGVLMDDILMTLLRVGLGYLTGASAGMALGILTAQSRRFRAVTEGVLQVARPLPAIALIPLFITWFGVGEIAKVMVIAWACFFPMWLGSHSNVLAVPEAYSWVAATLGVPARRRLREVIIPAAMAGLISSARISLGLAFAATVVSEMVGTSEGIGYRIFVSHQTFRYGEMVAALLLVGIIGAGSDALFIYGTKRLFPWLREGI